MKQKQCYFCTANTAAIDYKSPDLLRKFMTPQAQIIKKGRSGLCAAHQRRLAEAIKRARTLGLVPYATR